MRSLRAGCQLQSAPSIYLDFTPTTSVIRKGHIKIPILLIAGADRPIVFGHVRLASAGFLYAALDATAFAAFVKESRKKRDGATKLHRKSGEARDRSRDSFTER